MITLTLAPEQALNLRNLLDLAVKAGGMAAAELALPIDAEIRRAGSVYEQAQRQPNGKDLESGHIQN